MQWHVLRLEVQGPFSRLAWCVALLAIAAVAPHRQGVAQASSVRLLVPTASQGSTDTIARLVAEGLSSAGIGEVLVENVVGRNGTRAAVQVASSAPDGQTLLIATQSSHGIAPAFLQDVPYDAVRSFTPIVRFAAAPYVLVVGTSGPATIHTFLENARLAQGGWQYVSTGVLGPHHLIAEQYFRETGLGLRHVPMASGAAAIAKVISGEAQAMLPAAVLALPKIRSGQLRALAVTSGQRSGALPDVPTLRESGSAVESESWYGLVAPAGLPEGRAKTLAEAVLAVLRDPGVKAKFSDLAIDTRTETGAAFGKAIATEVEMWKRLAESMNAQEGGRK